MKNKFLFVCLLHTGYFINSPGKVCKNSKHIIDENNEDGECNRCYELEREKLIWHLQAELQNANNHAKILSGDNEVLVNKSSELEKCIEKLKEENALLMCGASPVLLKREEDFRRMEKEKDDNFNCILREKDTRISYLEKNQSSKLDKNVTIALKVSCVVVAGCFAWQFFLRDFLFYHFPKLDKGKIERMKREEARLAALRARA